jgi:hypothetical protein
MVTDNDPPKKKLSAEELVNSVMFPDMKGVKRAKKPTKGDLLKDNQMLVDMVHKLNADNEEISAQLFRSGLTHCAVHNAALRIHGNMGGKIIDPKIEKYKRRILEIVKATEMWKDWDKADVPESPEETDEPESGSGDDSNEG